MALINLSDFSRRLGMNQSGTGAFTYSSAKQGTMYLFKPRQVPDVVVRPYQYDFNSNFINELIDVVDMSTRQISNPIGGNLSAVMKMTGSTNANRAIAPAATGEWFNGRQYGDLWTCMIILDNVSFEGRHNPIDQYNRLLYFGFCLDEPVVNIFGNLSFNDGCAIMFTHVTQLDIKDVYGRNGRIVTSIPMADTDIVHPMNVLQASPNRQYFIRPQDLVVDNVYDSEGYEYTVPGVGYLQNQQYAERVSTALNNPKEQLSNIVSGFAKSINSANTQTNFPFGPNGVEISDSVSFASNIRSHMASDHMADRYLGLPVHEPIQLGDILGKYPILRDKTRIFEFPWQLQEQPMDNSAPTPINIWSSLLMSAVPSVFANYGISDATFRYDSVNQTAMSIVDRKPVYEVYELYTFMSEDSQVSIREKWNRALQYLEDNIFPIIIDQVGNFSVMVRYSSSKECAVQLNLIDMYNTINDGIVMTNALYGGLQSPVVGSFEAKEFNSREIVGAAQIVNSQVTHSVYGDGGMY